MKQYQRPLAFIVSGILAVIVGGVTFITLNDYGIVWDEPIYFVNGDGYWEWYKKPRLSNIGGFFHIYPDQDVHPPFRKLVAGMTHDITVTSTHFLDNTRGYRISGFLFLLPFVFFFAYGAIRQSGVIAGGLTSLLLFFHPAVFALANLVTLDYAVMTLWYGIGAMFLGGMTTVRRALVLGVLVGVSILTKMHGTVFALGIVLYWILGWISRSRKTQAFVPFRLAYLWIILTSAGVLVVVGWPYLWANPLLMFRNYLQIQQSFPSVASLFLGKISHFPPAFYVPFMVFATMPIWPCVLVAGGVYYGIRYRSPESVRLIFFASVPLLFFMLPGVPRYDGVRLFLPALPFLYLLGAGFLRKILTTPKGKYPRIYVVVLAFVLTVFTIYGSTAVYHPYELSYFNEIIGGIRGAWRLGFDTELWGSSFQDVLPYMNARKGTMFCIFPTTAPFYYYQAMGALEPGVIFDAGRGACTDLVLLMRRGLFPRDPMLETLVATQKPEYSVEFQSIPLVSVYKLPQVR